MAMSMKMMPRLSTMTPSGTCVESTSSPATSAGPRMLRLRACNSVQPVEQAVDRILEEAEIVLGRLGSSDREGQLHQRDVGLVGDELGIARILVGRIDDELDAFGRDALD